MTKVRYADHSETKTLAQLHELAMPDAFLTSLGIGPLRALYRSLISDLRAAVLVAERNGEIIGFIAGAVDARTSMNRAAPLIGLVASPKLLRPSVAKRAVETFRYSHDVPGPDAELLAIAVRPEARRSGTGKALVEALSAELRTAGAPGMRVVAGEGMDAANRFYGALGFSVAGSVEIHEGSRSIVWVTTWR